MTAPPTTQPSTKPVLAGIAYFALVFAMGFLLGTVRTFFVRDAPSGGPLLGVLIDLPIMLSASWFLCRYVLSRFVVAQIAFALMPLMPLVQLRQGRQP
jgi:hypothetical protein